MSTPLTSEQAEAMLATLTRHFGEPVLPASRYCKALRTWQNALDDRAARKRAELFPGIDGDYHKDPSLKEAAEKAHDAYRAATKDDPLKAYAAENKPFDDRYYGLKDLRSYEDFADQVSHVFLNITKSNLLARLIYNGETLREKMCPEHKGKWSGIEWSNSRCPHKCQLTGWLQEEVDQGKPLPGVQAVQLIPAGSDGEVTVVRDSDGQVLGQAKMVKPGGAS